MNRITRSIVINPESKLFTIKLSGGDWDRTAALRVSLKTADLLEKVLGLKEGFFKVSAVFSDKLLHHMGLLIADDNFENSISDTRSKWSSVQREIPELKSAQIFRRGNSVCILHSSRPEHKIALMRQELFEKYANKTVSVVKAKISELELKGIEDDVKEAAKNAGFQEGCEKVIEELRVSAKKLSANEFMKKLVKFTDMPEPFDEPEEDLVVEQKESLDVYENTKELVLQKYGELLEFVQIETTPSGRVIAVKFKEEVGIPNTTPVAGFPLEAEAVVEFILDSLPEVLIKNNGQYRMASSISAKMELTDPEGRLQHPADYLKDPTKLEWVVGFVIRAESGDENAKEQILKALVDEEAIEDFIASLKANGYKVASIPETFVVDFLDSKENKDLDPEIGDLDLEQAIIDFVSWDTAGEKYDIDDFTDSEMDRIKPFIRKKLTEQAGKKRVNSIQASFLVSLTIDDVKGKEYAAIVEDFRQEIHRKVYDITPSSDISVTTEDVIVGDELLEASKKPEGSTEFKESSSESDFIASYGEELKIALKNLKEAIDSVSSEYENWDVDVIEDFQDGVRDSMKVFDQTVITEIEMMVGEGEVRSFDYVVKMAISNMNFTGTEPQNTIYAIEKATKYIKGYKSAKNAQAIQVSDEEIVKQLLSTWYRVADDIMAVQSEFGGEDSISGEELRATISTYLPQTDEAAANAFNSKSTPERERLLKEAFPDEKYSSGKQAFKNGSFNPGVAAFKDEMNTFIESEGLDAKTPFDEKKREHFVTTARKYAELYGIQSTEIMRNFEVSIDNGGVEEAVASMLTNLKE